MTATPADEAGRCITTLQDFAGGYPAGIYARGLAESPDGQYIYVGTTGNDVLQIDTATWAVTTLVTLSGGSMLAFCGDDVGNLYALGPTAGGVTRIVAGVATNDWAVLPGFYSIGLGLNFGADGNLYVAAIDAFSSVNAVFKITTAGVVSEVVQLRRALSDHALCSADCADQCHRHGGR
jgi:YVTN family beta-propeller protein